jgi:hypothetical protein
MMVWSGQHEAQAVLTQMVGPRAQFHEAQSELAKLWALNAAATAERKEIKDAAAMCAERDPDQLLN